MLESLTFDVSLHWAHCLPYSCTSAMNDSPVTCRSDGASSSDEIGNDVDRRMAWLIKSRHSRRAGGISRGKKIEELFLKPNAPVQPTAVIAIAAVLALTGALLFFAERVVITLGAWKISPSSTRS